MEADRIELAVAGRFNDPLCDELTHYNVTREVPKLTTGLIERGAHSEGCVVVEKNILDWNDIHFHLPKNHGWERDCCLSVTEARKLYR